MNRGYLAGATLLWAGSACAQGISTPSDVPAIPKSEQAAPQRVTGAGTRPAPDPPGKPPKEPRPTQPKPTVAPHLAPKPVVASRPPLKAVETPTLLESWARPYLQGSVGYVDSAKWSGVALGAYAGIDFVASGKMLLGFRAGIENFGGGPAVAPADFWQASVVARVGYIAGDRFLPYIVFGPAVATSASKSLAGVTVGAGVEYRINENWSAAAEIDYSRFGSAMNSFAWSPDLSHGKFGASFLYHFPISPPQK